MRIIDADALIAEYDRVHVGAPGGARKLMQDALTIEPSAQPGQRWIPVTERLPEEDTKVIVSCTDDSGDSEFGYTTTGWHYKGMWLVDNERSCFVRAWMPLPKSYSERRQDA